jgi:hypothetical protein
MVQAAPDHAAVGLPLDLTEQSAPLLKAADSRRANRNSPTLS